MSKPARCSSAKRTLFRSIAAIVIIVAAASFNNAPASSLSPRGTKYEQHVAKQYSNWFQRTASMLSREGVLHFSAPVHEEITNRIYGCRDTDFCNDPDVEFAGPFILAGVRFNDDPPFRLQATDAQHTFCKTGETIRFTTQPLCWVAVFKAAKRQAAAGDIPDAYNHAPLLARSHFGDLQFLHAMASVDGETAAETQKRILMWAEFTWKVATGRYGLNTNLKDVDIAGFDDFFGKSGWTVQDLFTVGNPALRQHITDVAFGSILHTAEDSFAKGHAQRELSNSNTTCQSLPQLPAPHKILEFHSYAHQDERKHAQFDTRDAFENEMNTDSPNEVAVGTALRQFYDTKASWETVKPYFQCIFAVADPKTKASSGSDFVVE